MSVWDDPDFIRDELEANPPVPPTPLRLPPGMVWRAHDVLGVGHLLPKTPAAVQRYLCGRLPVADRFAWPMKSRCQWCVAELQEGRV